MIRSEICNKLSVANVDLQWNISIAIYLLADPSVTVSFSLANLQGKIFLLQNPLQICNYSFMQFFLVDLQEK